MTVNKIINELNARKDILGMSNAVIAERSGVSEPTVTRILSGKHIAANFEHVLAVAEVLGLDLYIQKSQKPEEMKKAQAERKAKFIMSMVRGNVALESVSISKRHHDTMFERTVDELLKGSNRKLWAA